MFDILENINMELKENILKKMKNDNSFNNYVKNCNRLNIKIFDKNNIHKLEDIVYNLNISKINFYKNLKNEIYNNEYIEKDDLEKMINKYLKKINMLENLKKYTELKYNFGLLEIIEFDNSLFLLSDDNIEKKNNKIFYYIDNLNNDIIEEYSNFD
jgi:hypothetical protein